MPSFPRLPRTFSRHFLSVRLRFLIVALLISISFLFLQFYALHSVSTKAPSSSSPPTSTAVLAAVKEPPSAPATTIQPVAVKYTILAVIKRFVDLMTFLEAPVFIVDPAILRHLLVLNGNPNSRCKFFCRVPDGIVTFGVAANFWSDRPSAFKSITSAGFHFVRVETLDPRISPLSPSWRPLLVPTHFLFEKEGFFLHLVIFYERSSNSFWFDQFRLPSNTTGGNSPTSVTTKNDNNNNANDQDKDDSIDKPDSSLEDYDDAADHRGKNSNNNKRDIDVETRLQSISRKLRLGATDAGSISRIETTRVNLDGVKVFVPKDPVHVLDEIPSSTFLECNHTRALDFFSRHPRDVSNDGEAFRHLARKTIVTAAKILDGLGIRFWISSGTLLGWYRQCDVITYSGDVDFGIFIHDYDARLIAEFQRAGLELMHLFGKTTDSFELSFAFGDMKLDLFFFYREGDDLVWNGGTQARTGNKFKYLFSRFSLCWADFLAVRVRVPCPTVPYLEANYGKDFLEPVKTWDWKKSPPNVRENGQWPREEWEQVIQSFQITD